MTTVKVFINSQNQAIFKCPVCERGRTIDVSEYKSVSKAITVNCKCRCGHVYTALLERRKYYRKDTNLKGSYSSRQTGNRGFMIVTNVSRSGLQMKLNFTPDFEVGDKLTVEFALDDRNQSQINREVVVRSIRGVTVGLEFTLMQEYDPLGPYLVK